MIKLKSLFRRGQNTSQNSSKHSSSTSGQQQQQQQQSHSRQCNTQSRSRHKSQSTQSLNAPNEVEAKVTTITPERGRGCEVRPVVTGNSGPYYHSHLSANGQDVISERGVDVGEPALQIVGSLGSQGHNRHQSLAIGDSNHRLTSVELGSQTLPHKKSKESGGIGVADVLKKGFKQPKVAPPRKNNNVKNNKLYEAVQSNIGGGDSIAFNSSSDIASYPMAAVASGTPSGQNVVVKTASGDKVQDELYALNPAFVAAAAAAGYQFISKEQQQMWESTNIKMQELQKQLERINREKMMADSRINELLPYQGEVSTLRSELIRMQTVQEKQQIDIVNLKYENESLRNRLRDVVNSPLSDAEKHQLIQDSQRLHSSAPASIALPTTTDSNEALPISGIGIRSSVGGTTGDVTAGATGSVGTCLTPIADWDKHSSSSEISVACLQDKIIQMEETHYSTNEELQATLQELADLQLQLSDTQAENERLLEEKDVLFQSLCRQTEKLNESRSQLNNLQELLLTCEGNKPTIASSSNLTAIADSGTANKSLSTTSLHSTETEMTKINQEREIKLMEMVKATQEEREVIQRKYDELNMELHAIRERNEQLNSENMRLRERIELLQSTLDAEHGQRKQIEQQFLTAKEDISQNTIETNRLTTLLENAKAKIDDLEQELSRGDKTDVSDLLETARKEKDLLEERAAELQEQLSRSKADQRRLSEQLTSVQEEFKSSSTNSQCTVSRLEYCLEQLQRDKSKLAIENQQLCDSTAELQVQCKCHLDDKEQLQKLLNETQQVTSDFESKLNETQKTLEELELHRQKEVKEWKQYESDLLMTVRVANDFKQEALKAQEKLALENKTLKEKMRMMEQQLDKINKQQQQQNETQQSVLSTVQQEMASRRNKLANNFTRQDSRLSVKTLIETIENNKQSKTDDTLAAAAAVGATVGNTTVCESRYSSNSSLNSATTTTNATTQEVNSEWTDSLNSRLNSGTSSINVNSSPSKSTAHLMCSSSKGGGTVHFRDQQSQLSQQQQSQQQQTHQTQNQTTTTDRGQTMPSLVGNNLNLSTMSKSFVSCGERRDPLNMLAKNGGSKRNALLKWCQNKTVGYRNIDITNFSSSWNDGLAFCAILHSYLPDRIPYDTLTPANKRRNFSLAFAAAESVGISTTLNINDMCQIERPDWTQVMSYVTAIYKRFET